MLWYIVVRVRAIIARRGNHFIRSEWKAHFLVRPKSYTSDQFGVAYFGRTEPTFGVGINPNALSAAIIHIIHTHTHSLSAANNIHEYEYEYGTDVNE